MRKWLMLLVLLVETSGCKSDQATAQVKDDGTALSGRSGPTTLVCSVTALLAANQTTDAALAPLRAFTGLTITVPAKVDGMMSQDIKTFAVVQMTGSPAAVSITQALDLYDRAGTLAQVSGGVYGPAPDYRPQFTAKVDLNTQAGDQTGFAALTLYQGTDAVSGTAQLACAWR